MLSTDKNGAFSLYLIDDVRWSIWGPSKRTNIPDIGLNRFIPTFINLFSFKRTQSTRKFQLPAVSEKRRRQIADDYPERHVWKLLFVRRRPDETFADGSPGETSLRENAVNPDVICYGRLRVHKRRGKELPPQPFCTGTKCDLRRVHNRLSYGVFDDVTVRITRPPHRDVGCRPGFWLHCP